MSDFQDKLLEVEFEEKVEILIPEYTKNDILSTTKPFDYVYKFWGDRFNHERALTQMAEYALKEHKIRNFRAMYKAYIEGKEKNKGATNIGNVTYFPDGCREYKIGTWRADEDGIHGYDQYGVEITVCSHPIYIRKKLINIETNSAKVELAYYNDKCWQYIIVDRETIACSRKITSLSSFDIAVTSETAKMLVKYFSDFETLNSDTITKLNCTSRLGWVKGKGFAPYVEDLIYDGETMSTIFETIKPVGDFEKWKKVIIEARNKSPINKIVLATSITSCLISQININNFMLHIWGTTEFGKSVATMMAASIWADPFIGKYIQTFNSTLVGREYMAGFLQHLPLMLDELQIAVDRKQFDEDIYKLCEGAGRLRGNKFGGTSRTVTWQNTIISNGEKPITSVNSGGGAVNRIIEIECKDSLFDDPREFCNVIRSNYGHAGKMFVEKINIDEVKEVFESYYKSLVCKDKTEKQTSAAAAILTADLFLCNLVLDNAPELKIEEIEPYLLSKQQVNQNERAYECLCGWISENSNNFRESELVKSFGKIEYNLVFITNFAFYRFCDENGFNSTALISYLKNKQLIIPGKKETMRTKKINKVDTRCLCLKLLDESDSIFDQ